MLRSFASLIVAALVSGSVAYAQAASTPKLAQRAGNPGNNDAKQAVVVNLNTATTSELERLPGIGARVAARIVEYRQKNGPFKKIEELMNVQGIGEKSFLKLRSQLAVSSPAKPDAPATRQQ